MPPTYSARLGEIADGQFDAALRKAGLGRFVAASTPSAGLFGQNVFLTTTAGEFVFRGAPHWFNGGPDDRWQFPKERLYADLLQAHTAAPVAWPQILDDSGEHFPWPYLITPRLPGLCLTDPDARKRLAAADWLGVARAMGETLAELHRLTWPAAGDFDPGVQALVGYPGGYGAHLAGQVRGLVAETRPHGRLTIEDEAWLEARLDADAGTPEPPVGVYVHNDYSLGNVLLAKDEGVWRVSGVVDLMTSCFGDPAADLSRQACNWLDADRACARTFIEAYAAAGGAAAPSRARLALLIAYERLLIWSYFTGPAVDAEFLRGRTFAAWADSYAARVVEMVFAG